LSDLWTTYSDLGGVGWIMGWMDVSLAVRRSKHVTGDTDYCIRTFLQADDQLTDERTGSLTDWLAGSLSCEITSHHGLTELPCLTLQCAFPMFPLLGTLPPQRLLGSVLGVISLRQVDGLMDFQDFRFGVWCLRLGLWQSSVECFGFRGAQRVNLAGQQLSNDFWWVRSQLRPNMNLVHCGLQIFSRFPCQNGHHDCCLLSPLNNSHKMAAVLQSFMETSKVWLGLCLHHSLHSKKKIMHMPWISKLSQTWNVSRHVRHPSPSFARCFLYLCSLWRACRARPSIYA